MALSEKIVGETAAAELAAKSVAYTDAVSNVLSDVIAKDHKKTLYIYATEAAKPTTVDAASGDVIASGERCFVTATCKWYTASVSGTAVTWTEYKAFNSGAMQSGKTIYANLAAAVEMHDSTTAGTTLTQADIATAIDSLPAGHHVIRVVYADLTMTGTSGDQMSYTGPYIQVHKAFYDATHYTAILDITGYSSAVTASTWRYLSQSAVWIMVSSTAPDTKTRAVSVTGSAVSTSTAYSSVSFLSSAFSDSSEFDFELHYAFASSPSSNTYSVFHKNSNGTITTVKQDVYGKMTLWYSFWQLVVGTTNASQANTFYMVCVPPTTSLAAGGGITVVAASGVTVTLIARNTTASFTARANGTQSVSTYWQTSRLLAEIFPTTVSAKRIRAYKFDSASASQVTLISILKTASGNALEAMNTFDASEDLGDFMALQTRAYNTSTWTTYGMNDVYTNIRNSLNSIASNVTGLTVIRGTGDHFNGDTIGSTVISKDNKYPNSFVLVGIKGCERFTLFLGDGYLVLPYSGGQLTFGDGNLGMIWEEL